MIVILSRPRIVALIVGCALAAAVGLPAASARQRAVMAGASAATGVDARILGTFVMRAHVTAVGVPGERAGETLRRLWTIVPTGCVEVGNVCQGLLLERQRSSHIIERVSLRRVAPGRYVGTGTFYVSLECLGRVYRLGSRARFRITLAVTSAVKLQDELFARSISARYSGSQRTDSTPCPLGQSHDAARYTGTASSSLPAPPIAGYTASVDDIDATAQFTDDSKAAAPGAHIVAQKWGFDDPRSGAANTSTLADPSHRFTARGQYDVGLVVLDSNGLFGAVTHVVTVPLPPVVPLGSAERPVNLGTQEVGGALWPERAPGPLPAAIANRQGGSRRTSSRVGPPR